MIKRATDSGYNGRLAEHANMQQRALEMEVAYVEFAEDMYQIARKYGVAVSTVVRYRRKYHWVSKRKAWLEEHPIDREYLNKIKDATRASTWEILRIKISDRIEKLDPESKDFEASVTKLTASLERAIRGERLEDGQSTTIFKKSVDPDTRDERTIIIRDTDGNDDSVS